MQDVQEKSAIENKDVLYWRNDWFVIWKIQDWHGHEQYLSIDKNDTTAWKINFSWWLQIKNMNIVNVFSSVNYVVYSANDLLNVLNKNYFILHNQNSHVTITLAAWTYDFSNLTFFFNSFVTQNNVNSVRRILFVGSSTPTIIVNNTKFITTWNTWVTFNWFNFIPNGELVVRWWYFTFSNIFFNANNITNRTFITLDNAIASFGAINITNGNVQQNNSLVLVKNNSYLNRVSSWINWAIRYTILVWSWWYAWINVVFSTFSSALTATIRSPIIVNYGGLVNVEAMHWPYVTTTERNALPFLYDWYIIYNITTGTYQVYKEGNWLDIV